MSTANRRGQQRDMNPIATSRRRIAGALAGAALGCLAARVPAQRARVVRLAFLGVVAPSFPITKPGSPWGVFFRDLSARGWIDGRNLKVEVRRLAGPDSVSHLAAEVVASRPDVIVCDTSSAVLALRSLTSTIPIVIHLVGFPVELGLVTSLARPGGNVTGSADFMLPMMGKYLELLREVVPGLRRIGMLWAPHNPSAGLMHAEFQRLATEAGLQFTSLPVARPDDVAGPLQAAREARLQALYVHPFGIPKEVFAWAIEHKLPTLGQAHRGALIGYGPDAIEQFETSARYVALILDGKSPADLPVVLPRRFRLVVNLRTMRAIGIELSRNFRIRVDEFLEE
ncbi:ABC transporter substrate-binding protein [Aquincola sp. S2]|uniref:ABC transporter substrate-binding protein n=1 Tax=Pseudaquabacterium terrae TaxID=2732868 RepID=A0ABX2EB71_9BURK|nr:ABC transporter substrate-binding protein [Aquabacterium terrae]NRF65806.1 ABC transporter substrate-binding protein [Aquabacterium terrae]